jgi:hypothetical protein
MKLSDFQSASSRRMMIAVGVAALLCAGSNLRAYPTHGQEPAAQKPEPPDALKLTSDFVLIWSTIKADKAADFESAWASIKAGLAKSSKDDLKQLGESIRVYKIDAPPADSPAGKTVTFMFHLDPPVKTQSYDPVKILFFSGAFERAEADTVWAKLKDCYVSINPMPLSKIGG